MAKLKAWLMAAAGVAGGLVYGPLVVQAAIVAALVVVVVVYGLAHAHDMTVGRAAALYGGRAILALAKAAAIALVEWPLRAGHRASARFDVALRVQLLALRSFGRANARVRAFTAGTGALPAAVPPVEVLICSGVAESDDRALAA